jgi:hypothetical protein
MSEGDEGSEQQPTPPFVTASPAFIEHLAD